LIDASFKVKANREQLLTDNEWQFLLMN